MELAMEMELEMAMAMVSDSGTAWVAAWAMELGTGMAFRWSRASAALQMGGVSAKGSGTALAAQLSAGFEVELAIDLEQSSLWQSDSEWACPCGDASAAGWA